MKCTAGLALLIFALTACASPNSGDARLDGVWVSDKGKTLANIGATAVSGDRLRFLRENLGQLHMCFSGAHIAAFFVEANPQPRDVATYQVLESSPSAVTLQINGESVLTLHFEGECFRHAIPDWGYQEYFCRKPAQENPCA